MDEKNEKPRVNLAPGMAAWAYTVDPWGADMERQELAAGIDTYEGAPMFSTCLAVTRDLMAEVSWQGVVKVFEHGVEKYEPRDYQRFYSRPEDCREIYLGSIKRHLLAAWSGEELDPESGLRHLAHAAAGALILLEMELSQ